MNNSHFFSIITPNYNSGDKLLRALNSLKSNKVSYEHIIIDDCSTDNSFSKIKEITLQDQNSSLVLLRNDTNSGPGVSRNAGLDIATGKYIIFLDADDYFVENALDKMHSALQSKYEIDILIFGYYLLRAEQDKDLLRLEDNRVEKLVCPVREYILDEIISSPWGKCIEARLAKNFHFPRLQVSEDAIYNLDVFIKAENVFKLNSTLYLFDKTNDKSLTRKNFNREEFLKFQKGWVFFERKVKRELKIENGSSLLSSRKVKFCVLYYISRIILAHDKQFDRFIIGSIRKVFMKNIGSARHFVSYKVTIFCFIFCAFPSLTIKLCKALGFRF